MDTIIIGDCRKPGTECGSILSVKYLGSQLYFPSGQHQKIGFVGIGSLNALPVIIP